MQRIATFEKLDPFHVVSCSAMFHFIHHICSAKLVCGACPFTTLQKRLAGKTGRGGKKQAVTMICSYFFFIIILLFTHLLLFPK